MSEESIRDIRLAKLAKMRELGHDPYAVERFETTASASDLLANYDFGPTPAERAESQTPDPKLPTRVSFAGRVTSYRLMGKAGFAHLSDGDGKIQAYFRRDDLQMSGEIAQGWELFNLLDIGDHVGVSGELFITKTGEKSIHVRHITPLSKCLHTLPLGKVLEEKDDAGNVTSRKTWYELEDVEIRYRHRHLDLIARPEEREKLVQRSKIVAATRRFFENWGYIEVETPMLQFVAGGAAARPFLTHYNAYDVDVKLRISLELYLKRLICGDLPKVYEIGRVFRNEGVSNRHNPEFTLLEWYEAYANLEDMMAMVEGLFRSVAEEVFGSTSVSLKSDRSDASDQSDRSDEPKTQINFSQPWARLDLLSGIQQYSGIEPGELAEFESAKAAMARVGLPTAKEDSLGGIIEKLLEHFVEPNLIQPTFIINYPIETSPLAKKVPGNPRLTRRFEGYIRGREVCNAFSEINDPIDQRERFEEQVKAAAKGADETHPMDEEFLYALECGMPPAGGCGIGIDRLAMILTGAENLREIILFPTMKPEAPPEASS
ncbi:MAG: lysine--tRNA ligase [Armatimonadetes bacterium]|nr:lysine--tRNA ligase [Armatimonadota bacterium]